MKTEGPPTIELLAETNIRVWLPREDEYLLQLIEVLQPKKWTHIAKELNTALYNGQKIKTPKQCRERWHNHLNPDLKKGNWTLAEDIYILEQQIECGNSWSKISKGLNNRNENSVKNRWNSLVKRYKKTTGRNEFNVHEVLHEKRQAQSQGAMIPGRGPYSTISVQFPQMVPTMQAPMYYDPKLENTYASYNSMSSGSTDIPSYTSMGSVEGMSGSFGSFGEAILDPYTGQPMKQESGVVQQPYVFVSYPNYGVANPVPQVPQTYQQNMNQSNVFQAPPK